MMKKTFLNKTDSFPTLYIDMVFVESIRPVLFTCLDETGQLYICSCCYASGDQCIWIIANTTLENVISLLENKCEIFNMFGNNDRVFVVTQHNDGGSPKFQSLTLQSIPKEFLPTKGYRMDAEDGEFEEELEELRSRLEDSYKYEISLSQDSFYATTQMIHISIKLGISTKIPEDRYWENNMQIAVAAGV